MDLPGGELIWWHRERCGRSEAVHAVMKHDLACGRLPSAKFGSNAAWWAAMVLAYNVASALKRLVLGGTWAKKRMKAVRFGFINIAARLVRHARQTVLRICRRSPAYTLLRDARETVLALAQAPPAAA
ncbi:MAG: transposase [Planctomycetota bacterium]